MNSPILFMCPISSHRSKACWVCVCVCACVHVCLCVGGEPCSLMFTPLWLHIDDNDNDDDDDDDNVHSNIILAPAQYQCTGLAVELG